MLWVGDAGIAPPFAGIAAGIKMAGVVAEQFGRRTELVGLGGERGRIRGESQEGQCS